MGKFIDLTGQRFGALTVQKRAPTNSRANRARWVCSCTCQNKTIVVIAGCHLVSGHTRSCGCLRKQVTAARCFKNLIGQRFGRLVVLERAGRNKHGQILWLCRCNCGYEIEIVVSGNLLTRGNTKSCGCLHREFVSKLHLTHGMSKSREYASYHSAKQRCINLITRTSPTTADAASNSVLPASRRFLLSWDFAQKARRSNGLTATGTTKAAISNGQLAPNKPAIVDRSSGNGAPSSRTYKRMPPLWREWKRED